MATTPGDEADTISLSPSPLRTSPGLPTPSLPPEKTVLALALDRKVVQAFFLSLRVSIPPDVQRRLICDSVEELQFLVARQPRLSSFHHRRRESLRHPALAMATKRYYYACRRRRLELENRRMAAASDEPSSLVGGTSSSPRREEAMAAQRETELVDLLLSEYAQQATGFFDDYNRRRPQTGNSAGNAGSSVASLRQGSASFSVYASSSISRLVGGMGGDAEGETSLRPLANRGRTPSALELGSGGTSAAGGILLRRPPSAKYAGVSESNLSPWSEPLRPTSASRSRVNNSVIENESNSTGRGRNTPVPSASAGQSTSPLGMGRFFTQRRRNANRVGAQCGDRGRGRGGTNMEAGWMGELRSQLLRRVEKVQATANGNDPYVLVSARPVEHLLCCYGGVLRDPVALALSSVSMTTEYDGINAAEADPMYHAIVEDDLRWEHLAGCQRQLLRAASGPCQEAAKTVSSDSVVNDIIRRFWDRLTVSVAAQTAHKAQEAHKSRAAADADIAAAASVNGARRAGEMDEDDLNEIPDNNRKGQTNASGESTGGGPSGRRGMKKMGAALSTRDAAGPSKRSRGTKPNAARANKKKGKATEAGTVGGSSATGGSTEPSGNVALYMTPLQYVYLHTRIAHVLLPECDAAEVELLPYIQEDLLVDAAYDEQDPMQVFYFGEAPRLPGDVGRQPLKPSADADGGDPQVTFVDSKRHASAVESGLGFLSTGGGTGTQQEALVLQQRFLKVRRNGYGLGGVAGADGADRGDANEYGNSSDVTSLGPSSSVAALWNGSMATSRRMKGLDSNPSMAAVPLSAVPTSFSISQLPALTYPQFWCSMMELADNWTCCAGNPVETALFLWELYAEVFGHDWSEDDRALAAAVEKKSAKGAMSPAEKKALEQVEAETMQSFEALLAELRHQWSLSSSRRESLAGTYGANTRESARVGSSSTDRHRRSHNKRGSRSDHTAITLSDTDSEADSLLLASSSSELSSGAWMHLLDGTENRGEKWAFTEFVGKDGVTRRYRRRIHHRRPLSHSQGGPAADFLDESCVIEEELDEKGAVVCRRKRRVKKYSADDVDLESEDDTSMYIPDARSPQFRRRKYYDDQPKKIRRLEVRRGVAFEKQQADSRSSSMTSWSSVDDGATEDRRQGRRRRPRTLRVGHRSAHQRYSRDGRKEEVRRRRRVAQGVRERKSQNRDMLNDETKDSSPATRGKTKSVLTAEEVEHLMSRKEWLLAALGAEGINLPSSMFDDPAEQILLYDLLRLAEKSAEGHGGKGFGRGGGGLFNLDGEGNAANLSGLAALLAQSQAFSLDDLEHSVLMRRLLGESDADRAQGSHLSPQQMQAILLSLLKGQRGGADRQEAAQAELEGARDRRLNLLRMLEEQKASLAAQKRAKDAAPPSPDPLTKETFGLTEVSPMTRAPQPKAKQDLKPLRPLVDKQPPPILRAPSPVSSETSGLPDFACGAIQLPDPRPPSHRSPGGMEGDHRAPSQNTWKVSPATLAERRELERLFRELEKYWADQFSHQGRYRVDVVDYTAEQLEEFFAHLHLGSRQRALLRGRAPLAAASSLVGGTLHQDRERISAGFADRSKPENLSSDRLHPFLIPAPPLQNSAPVKLFTLTTEDSLDGALLHSYKSYLEDKAFSEALYGGMKLDLPRSAPPSSATKNSLPPLTQPGTRVAKKNSTGLSAMMTPSTHSPKESPRTPPKPLSDASLPNI